MFHFFKKKDREEITPMYVIVGLGNPKEKYAHTRHNAGFDVIDVLAKTYNIKMKDLKFKSVYGAGRIEGQPVLLLKPQTFMNSSGEAVEAALNYYKLDPTTQVIIIYDDIALKPGKIRIRKKGSAGGHNGVKSVIAKIGTQEFMRIRVGIGETPEGWELVDYVLSYFSKEEKKLMAKATKETIEAVRVIIKEGVDMAMNRFNGKD